jgi:hypothetical protein
MKKLISVKQVLAVTALLVTSLVLTSQALASNRYVGQPQQLSMGAFFSGQVGASATYILSATNAVDIAVSQEMGGDQNTAGWADYLFIYPNSFAMMDWSFGWYWGGGVKIRTENNPDVEEEYMAGPRAAAGITSALDSWPIELYGETAFTYHVTQATKTEFDIAIGARYYF